MKKISSQYFILVLIAGTLFLSSCYEEDPWLEDNITRSGDKFPVIYMNALAEEEYNAGDEVQILLEFFSEGELEEIILYETIGDGTRQLISETPYAPAFSEVKQLDTLVLVYSVPTVADTANIVLEAEAVNANGLSKTSSQNLVALPSN